MSRCLMSFGISVADSFLIDLLSLTFTFLDHHPGHSLNLTSIDYVISFPLDYETMDIFLSSQFY